MSQQQKRVALVTGGNKGLGYHLVALLAKSSPDLTVLLGARDLSRGEEAMKKLSLLNVHAIQVDVDDKAQLQKAAEEIKTKYGGLDLLANNAGMAFKGDAFDANVVDTTFKTNYYGVLDAIDAFLPLIREGGRIVNTSSGMSVMTLGNMKPDLRAKFLDDSLTIQGLTTLMNEFRDAVADGSWQAKGYPKSAYGFSKVGCSILSKILSRNLPRGITMSAVCPGWCRTDMAGDKAPRSAEEGGETLAYVCLLPSSDKVNGQYFEPAQPDAPAKISSLTRATSA